MKLTQPEPDIQVITKLLPASEEEVTEIQPSRGLLALDLSDIWHYRELLYFLTWRDIKVRYKQTALGAAWAILQPVLTMLVFSLIFGVLIGVQSEGFPYPVFAFTALLPWQLFAFALTQSSNSLVSNQSLITKVYFPRLVIPVASVMAGLVDFAIAFGVLLVMMLIYRLPLSVNMLALPFLALIAVITALAVGLWLSALNVKYRDVRHIIPFLTQVWMYLCPIAYSIELIPEKWRLLYSLNPMTGVIEGFRWAILGKTGSVWPTLLASCIIVLFLLITGLIYFKHTEDNFADLV